MSVMSLAYMQQHDNHQEEVQKDQEVMSQSIHRATFTMQNY